MNVNLITCQRGLRPHDAGARLALQLYNNDNVTGRAGADATAR